MAATEKQIKFAERIAQSLGEEVPQECYEEFDKMKDWIDENIQRLEKNEDGRVIFKPSEKQTSFAENIKNRLGVPIPEDAFVDAEKMSAFISEHADAYKAAGKKNTGYTEDTL